MKKLLLALLVVAAAGTVAEVSARCATCPQKKEARDCNGCRRSSCNSCKVRETEKPCCYTEKVIPGTPDRVIKGTPDRVVRVAARPQKEVIWTCPTDTMQDNNKKEVKTARKASKAS